MITESISSVSWKTLNAGENFHRIHTQWERYLSRYIKFCSWLCQFYQYNCWSANEVTLIPAQFHSLVLSVTFCYLYLYIIFPSKEIFSPNYNAGSITFPNIRAIKKSYIVIKLKHVSILLEFYSKLLKRIFQALSTN